MTAVGHADDAPPDAELLEFIGEWGESAPLVDAAEDASAQDANNPPPPPVEADHADE